MQPIERESMMTKVFGDFERRYSHDKRRDSDYPLLWIAADRRDTFWALESQSGPTRGLAGVLSDQCAQISVSRISIFDYGGSSHEAAPLGQGG
jgi:hypothetical protein